MKPQIIQNIPPQNMRNMSVIQNVQNIERENYSVFQNQIPSQSVIVNNNMMNNQQINQNNNVMNQPNIPHQPFNNPFNQNALSDPFSNGNDKAFSYEYYIAIKNKSNDLIIFEPGKGFTQIKIGPSNFQDKNDTFETIPDSSRHVNLGSSILLTGGVDSKRQRLNNAYLFTIGPSNYENEKYEVNILPYGKMTEGRERHNIIFLHDKNLVFICSGFFSESSEFTNINESIWKSSGKMNEIRSNSTLAYVNKRFIISIGGYKPSKDKQSG
jgi:hypothetical protein